MTSLRAKPLLVSGKDRRQEAGPLHGPGEELVCKVAPAPSWRESKAFFKTLAAPRRVTARFKILNIYNLDQKNDCLGIDFQACESVLRVRRKYFTGRRGTMRRRYT